MSDPFLGEIRVTSFPFAMRGWATCDGQLLPINQNQALFSLLGTTYGGDGVTTFALPDLRGRAPMHWSATHSLGERGGAETHTLTVAEMPRHNHVPTAATTATTADPTGARWAPTQGLHYAGSAQVVMASDAVSQVGSTQAHPNLPPYLALTFQIALMGVFPSRS